MQPVAEQQTDFANRRNDQQGPPGVERRQFSDARLDSRPEVRELAEAVDQEEDRVKRVVDRINTTGTVWLGLTVGCARCHSHKIDPIPQKDYYRFLAFFQNLSPHGKGKTNLVSISAPAEKRRSLR